MGRSTVRADLHAFQASLITPAGISSRTDALRLDAARAIETRRKL